MSRSYKNVANVSDGCPHNWYKKYSNHVERQRKREMLHAYEIGDIVEAEALETASGCSYKHNGLTWSIRDYSFSYFHELPPTQFGLSRLWDPEEWREEVRKMKRK